jgi:hypothetical protein
VQTLGDLANFNPQVHGFAADAAFLPICAGLPGWRQRGPVKVMV